MRRNLPIFWQFARRDIEVQFRGSILGILWIALGPLLMLGLYTVVFGYIFGGAYGVVEGETKLDYALGIFLGLSLFNWIARTLATAPHAVVGQPNLVKKVVFPIGILPAAVATGAAIHALVSLTLCLIGVALLGPGLDWRCLWLLVILPPVGLLAFGLSWMLASVGVFFRDISQLVPLLSMTLLYTSAVFYAVEQVPQPIWQFLRWNPLVHAVDAAHSSILWGRSPDSESLLYLWGASLAICLIGYLIFRRSHRNFADVL
ncbi:MAG: ABC transporter permease [Verrucomicrobiota bacterium]